MENSLIASPMQQSLATHASALPALFIHAGQSATERLLEFFTAEIENDHTRKAYFTAVKQFCTWCETQQLELAEIRPWHVALYMKQLQTVHQREILTVKQHLAAIRKLFDYLVTGQIVEMNPAASVRGPKYSVETGKTPAFAPEEITLLINSIDTSTIGGLRDRALIGLLLFTAARINAVLQMNVEDYYQASQKRWYIRIREKRGKDRQIPVTLKAQEYLDAYIEAAGIGDDRRAPLFRSLHRYHNYLTQRRLMHQDAWAMIKRRIKRLEMSDKFTCHSFRATWITEYLKSTGDERMAQQIAGHASASTTRMYDKRNRDIRQEEMEKVDFPGLV